MKKNCGSLREHAMKIINFKNKKMKVLTKEQQESYKDEKICYICQGKYAKIFWKIKNILKLEIIVIMQGNIGAVLRIAYVI